MIANDPELDPAGLRELRAVARQLRVRVELDAKRSARTRRVT